MNVIRTEEIPLDDSICDKQNGHPQTDKEAIDYIEKTLSITMNNLTLDEIQELIALKREGDKKILYRMLSLFKKALKHRLDFISTSESKGICIDAVHEGQTLALRFVEYFDSFMKDEQVSDFFQITFDCLMNN